MSACENFPQELIAAVADNIRDDKVALKAFSLVCRAWTNAARDHLFATMTINERRLNRIHDANYTAIYTPFVRHLRIKFCGNQEKFWQNVMPLLADFKTPRLRSLTISAVKWRSLLPTEQSAFINRFQSIACLQLDVFDTDRSTDIVPIICSLPHLERLILRPNWQDDGLEGSPLPLSPLLLLPKRLSTLDIFYAARTCRGFLEWLCSIPEQLSICAVTLTVDHLLPEDLGKVNMFLKVLGPSLEVFWCMLYDDLGDDECPCIDLTYNTHLRSVHFYVGTCLEYLHNDILLATYALSRVGSRQLEEITFNLDTSVEDHHTPDANWIQVDEILARPQFSTLKNVRICALPTSANLPALFATLMPKCHARGIISYLHPLLWQLWTPN